MREITYLEAIKEALDEEMARIRAFLFWVRMLGFMVVRFV